MSKTYRYFWLPLLILFMIVFGTCKSPVTEEIPLHTRHIVGTVTDKTDGSPIGNALIKLEYLMSRELASTRTDKNGYYSLKYYDKPPTPPNVGSGWGAYLNVRATAEGYRDKIFDIRNTTDTQTVDFQLLRL